MVALVDLANQALGEAAARSSIGSLDENRSEAKAAKLYIYAVRDQILRAARWNFAGKVDTLTLLKAAPGTPENSTSTATSWDDTQPAPPWLYAYAYPANAIAFWRVLRQPTTQTSGGVPIYSAAASNGYLPGISDNTSPAAFRVSTDDDDLGHARRVVLTNESQALGEWSRPVDDPNLWDAGFQEALVQALAGKLAMAVSGDKQLAATKFQMANRVILEARVANGNEGYTNITREAEWIQARSGAPYAMLPGVLMAAYGPLFAVA